MTDDQHDGILDPQASEPIELPPELAAAREWLANPTADTWSAASAAMSPPTAADELGVAMHAYAIAGDGAARELSMIKS